MRNKLANFQKRRLTQARYRKLLTMSDVANLIGVTRQMVSAYERGNSEPSPDKIRELAKHLNVAEQFFTLPFRDLENSRASLFTYRTLASSTGKARNQAEAFFEWNAHLLSLSSQYVDLPSVNIPDFRIPDYMAAGPEIIEELAERTRRAFGLGDGPISDLTLLLENKGVSVNYVGLANGMDGVSAWYGDRPIVLINWRFPCVRRRFDLAHELGHLVLHKWVPEEEQSKHGVLKKMESDAHRFASAFLLPEKTFSQEVYGIDLPALTQLKERWRVSIQAIIFRLCDLQIISEYQKQRLFQRISSAGMRKKEPLDDSLPVENARLLHRIFELLHQNNILMLYEIMQTVWLPQQFLEWVIGFSSSALIPRQPDNVITIKRPV
jgi:Zn-dependent peptidase ImmA (M78 family)/transcriptional regulator with XRE-family HTH domain